MVPRAGAGDVQQVAFGVVDLLEVTSVADLLCNGMTSSSQAITATARNSMPSARCMVASETWPAFGAALAVRTVAPQSGGFGCGPGARELDLGPDEDGDFAGTNLGGDSGSKPGGDAGGLGGFRIAGGDLRRRSLKERDGFAGLGYAVNVADLGAEEAVGLPADLLRGAVADTRRCRAATDVNAERPPGKRLAEEALAEVTGKKESVRAGRITEAFYDQLAKAWRAEQDNILRDFEATPGGEAELSGRGHPHYRTREKGAPALRKPGGGRTASPVAFSSFERHLEGLGTGGRAPATL